MFIGFHVKYLLFFSYCKELEFRQIYEKYYMRKDRQTGREQTDMTKLIVAFRIVAKESVNKLVNAVWENNQCLLLRTKQNT